jgi:anti-sigma factor RsiW
MDHVIERLGAWLGGELEGGERAAVEAHLAACAACRREADALQAVWRTLGAAPAPARTASVWPAVRARTFAAPGGWFYGSRPLTRLSLGAAAVACGLLVGALLPRSGGDPLADATLWTAGSRVLDEEAAGALDVWLDLAAADAEVER